MWKAQGLVVSVLKSGSSSAGLSPSQGHNLSQILYGKLFSNGINLHKLAKQNNMVDQRFRNKDLLLSDGLSPLQCINGYLHMKIWGEVVLHIGQASHLKGEW